MGIHWLHDDRTVFGRALRPGAPACAGRREFENAVRAHPADDVHAARRARARGDSASRSLAGALLIALGGTGSGVMAGHLQSGAWQVWLFALFAAVGIAGLVLAWIGRPLGTRRDPA